MTPTPEMQQIEASRQRLLKNQTSKLSRKLINEVADELHDKEIIKHKRLSKPTQVGDIAFERETYVYFNRQGNCLTYNFAVAWALPSLQSKDAANCLINYHTPLLKKYFGVE